MRLAEKYRPRGLDNVIGQPCVVKLRRFVAAPFATGWLFTGQPGTGKSATALALAADLGAVDEFSGLSVVCTAQLGKEEAERQVKRLHQRCLIGQWNVLILEELERLSPQCQVFLKVALASENLPARAVVIATSNDTSAIDPALLERFGKPLAFDGWMTLATAGAIRVARVWENETGGLPLPYGADRWGWYTEGDRIDGKRTRYSLRAAMDAMQQALLELPEPAELAGAA